MGFYQAQIVPWLTHLAMRQRNLIAYRNRVVSAASGRVLEIGIGSGLNLPFYREDTQIIGLEPSARLLAMTRSAAQRGAKQIELMAGSAEYIPLDNRSIDTVVTTWTLCSISDVERALQEARRVLRPDGQLLFVEHGRAPEMSVRLWQDRLTPIWKHIAGGCHLNRAIGKLLEHAGFRIDRLDTGYMPGPKLMTFMYEGAARPR